MNNRQLLIQQTIDSFLDHLSQNPYFSTHQSDTAKAFLEGVVFIHIHQLVTAVTDADFNKILHELNSND